MNWTQLLACARSRRIQISAALIAAIASLSLVGSASASKSQVAIIQDDQAVRQDPNATLAQFRQLGATTIRVLVSWQQVAPNPNSKSAPKHFKATDPNAYPASGWATYDNIVNAAKQDGMTVDLDVAGAPPQWAQGKGVPRHVLQAHFGWKVNATDYGQFMQAIAKRYDGKFKPPGVKDALPRVRFWSIWNEPNFGQDLGPQAVGAKSKFDGYSVAPMYYRNLVRSGWSALQKYVKGSTILVGEFAGQGQAGPKNHAHPQGLPGNYAITSPLPFIRTLYCVNDSYKRLTGTAAKQAGCPGSAKAARSFRKDNPALFDASAIGMHPYSNRYAPDTTKTINKDFVILPVINRLGTAMDRVTRAYGSGKRFPIYSTEYGFVTSPPQPKGRGYPSEGTAASYLNQAEYLSYKNGRVRSYAQYLLKDPPNLLSKHVGLFSSGLLTDKNKAKPAFNAYRLPLWMPHQSVKRNSRPEVWGAARPAHFASVSNRSGQRVRIQLQANGRGSWKTLATVTAAKTNGYFDTHVKLSSSGKLRLQYTYPKNEPFLPMGIAGRTVVSRYLNVKVH